MCVCLLLEFWLRHHYMVWCLERTPQEDTMQIHKSQQRKEAKTVLIPVAEILLHMVPSSTTSGNVKRTDFKQTSSFLLPPRYSMFQEGVNSQARELNPVNPQP